jgi:hypothetical protein
MLVCGHAVYAKDGSLKLIIAVCRQYVTSSVISVEIKLIVNVNERSSTMNNGTSYLFPVAPILLVVCDTPSPYGANVVSDRPVSDNQCVSLISGDLYR